MELLCLVRRMTVTLLFPFSFLWMFNLRIFILVYFIIRIHTKRMYHIPKLQIINRNVVCLYKFIGYRK